MQLPGLFERSAVWNVMACLVRLLLSSAATAGGN
jgi:hypothetical protein